MRSPSGQRAPSFRARPPTPARTAHLAPPPLYCAGKPVVRPYTPTSPVHQRGTFDLIVKTYPNGKVRACGALPS